MVSVPVCKTGRYSERVDLYRTEEPPGLNLPTKMVLEKWDEDSALNCFHETRILSKKSTNVFK